MLSRRRNFLGGVLLGGGLSALGACQRGQRSGRSGARVVSLSPSTTEAMFAIGVGELLVGRSRHCDFPKQAQRLPRVGGFADPNLEAVFSLRPTLVIGAQGPAGPSVERQLAAQAIATYFPSVANVAAIAEMLRGLGQRVGAAEGAAKVVQRIERRVKTVRAWAEQRSAVPVVMVFDARPIYVAGLGGFPDELIRLSGGRNLIDRGGAYPTIDIERLLNLDPDVIIDAVNVGHGQTSELASLPGWPKLRAVREGRLRRLRSSAALRPGPRIADGLADVARALHDETPPS